MINENFLNMLRGLQDPRKLEAVKTIMAKYKEQNAVDNKFYSNKLKVKQCMNKLFDIINTSDPFLETLIKIEGNTPYSIFSYILQENFSDIMFHGNGYILSDNIKEEKVEIPEELLDIYRVFIDHFIDNIVFLSSKKFDTGNAILDAEIDTLRFNLIHKTLNSNGLPVIVIRTQTIQSSSLQMSDSYINSVCDSEEQVLAIQKYAQKGNAIIFGETGSGKTTLLKYMGNYKLKEKRNLVSIEDTKELNIDVPLALLTNHRFKIKDLFVASLRQNPSHVLIGETRTDEIVDILEAALTTNVTTTIHANSFLRAVQRIVFMSMSRKIPPQQILDLVNASIDCFIFMENRKVKEVWVHKDGVISNVYEAYEQVK